MRPQPLLLMWSLKITEDAMLLYFYLKGIFSKNIVKIYIFAFFLTVLSFKDYDWLCSTESTNQKSPKDFFKNHSFPGDLGTIIWIVLIPNYMPKKLGVIAEDYWNVPSSVQNLWWVFLYHPNRHPLILILTRPKISNRYIILVPWISF